MFNKLKARSEQDNDTIKKLKALREEYRTKLGDYQQLSAKYETFYFFLFCFFCYLSSLII